MPSKKSLTRFLSAAAAVAAAFGVITLAACGGGGGGGGATPTPTPAPRTTYTGTLYMASEGGGHVAVVPVTIDPTNTSAPISVGSLSKVQLGGTPGSANLTHVFHDVRYDGAASKLYYSAIFADSTTTANAGKVHLGYVDLAASNAVKDAVIDTPAGAGSMIYCGSGQTSTTFLPMTMSYPAYIDAIAKSAVTAGASLSPGASVKRTIVNDLRGGNGDYVFAHGVASPDGSKLYMAVNETSAGNGGMMSKMAGAVTGYLVKTSDLVAGTATAASVTAHNTVTGLSAGNTIAFRSNFTPDGTKILQAGGDRFLLLNAADLTVLDNNTQLGGAYAANGGVENHDALPTPDGKYAILSLRFKASAGAPQDSGLQLYDLAAKQVVGNPVSTCNACHSLMGAVTTPRLTCGVDGKLTTVTQ